MLPITPDSHASPVSGAGPDAFSFLSSGGEMGRLVREFDWSKTSLGPVADWPQSLRTTLSIVLGAKLPMGLWWGEDLIQFYNDAYRPCLGQEGKHPGALGQRGQDCWPEAWPLLEPLIAQVLAGGEATWSEDQLIPIYRNGRQEEAYWTFSYSPVRDESGKIAGVLVLCQETTRQVEALKLADQRFVNFVRQATVGIIVLAGQELVVEVVNEAYGRLIDRSPEELTGKPLFTLIPEAEPYFRPILEQVRTTGEPLYLYDYPYFVLVEGARKEGFLDLVYQPYRETEGSIRGVMVLCHDVTEKVRARRKAEESEARLRSVIAAAPAAIGLFVGRDLIIEMPNKAFIDIVGKGPAITGKPLREVMPELISENQPFLQILDQVFTSGERFEAFGTQVKIVQQGVMTHNYYDFSYTPLRDEQGQVYAILDIAVDVTEQVLARQKIAESEEHFRTFANNIQNLAWMAEPEGWIYWYNQQWYDYTGTTLEEMQGWGWERVHHPDHLERVVAFVKEAWQQGETWELTFPLRGADGEYRWFLTRAYAVRDAQGQVIRWIGTNTNIDAQKRAQVALVQSEREAQALAEELAAANEELQAANEEIQTTNEELGISNAALTRTNADLSRVNADLDNFVYTASHDLKAPILNIEGLLKAMERQLGTERMQQENMQQIYGLLYGSVSRFKETILDLTEVARISKESPEDVGRIAVADLLTEVLQDLEPLIREAGARLERTLDCPPIQFSKKNLKSILYNLLSNAIKFRSPERALQVQITCHTEKDYYVLTVADNGIGMDTRQEEKIFGLFKRLHTHVDGTGIGLYIVKKIVENAGGKIQVESQVGAGSTFRIHFKHHR